MKNKKVLLIDRFSVQNYKVSVESWKSYIVPPPQRCWRNMWTAPNEAIHSSSIMELDSVVYLCLYFESMYTHTSVDQTQFSDWNDVCQQYIILEGIQKRSGIYYIYFKVIQMFLYSAQSAKSNVASMHISWRVV